MPGLLQTRRLRSETGCHVNSSIAHAHQYDRARCNCDKKKKTGLLCFVNSVFIYYIQLVIYNHKGYLL